MNCEWGAVDCKFLGSEKCDTCFTERQNYKQAEVKAYKGMAHRQAKPDGRMGSGFEYKNHKSNQEILSEKAVTGMTLNSGATVLEKGDEQIRGIIRIMEELKTKVKEQAPGKKNFTIQKAWLDKLRLEAKREDMEFYYLKFCFHEDDKDVYVITEQDIIMSMVKTMVEDRKEKKKLELEFSAARNRIKSLEAELSAAKISLQTERSAMEQLVEAKKIDKLF